MSADARTDLAARLHASWYHVPYICKAGKHLFDRWGGGGWSGTAFGGSNYLSLGCDGAPFLEGFACLVAWIAKAGISKIHFFKFQ